MLLVTLHGKNLFSNSEHNYNLHSKVPIVQNWLFFQVVVLTKSSITILSQTSYPHTHTYIYKLKPTNTKERKKLIVVNFQYPKDIRIDSVEVKRAKTTDQNNSE